MKRLIAANWKMNFGPGEASLFVAQLAKHVPVVASTEVVLCVPTIDLYPLHHDAATQRFTLGAQNLHPADHGPYTGEVSGSMLKGLAKYVLVGHSERRAMGETDKEIAAKLAAATRNGLKPILCVGERLDDRHAGVSRKVVVEQVEAALDELAADDVHDLTIAYEPVWAINHHDGHVVHHAVPADFKTILPAIRNVLEDRYGAAGAKVRLLYGGSVEPDHTKAYLEAPLVNGLLVGTASLNSADFAKIVASTSL